jgi:hypothetical protein
VEFVDYYDKICSIQISSLATDDCIWLGINDVEPQIMASDAAKLGIETTEKVGWIKYPIPDEVLLSSRMHLSREQVAEILPILQKFVETGEIH